MIVSHNSLNGLSLCYLMQVEKIRVGLLSPARALQLMLMKILAISHDQLPGRDCHWQRSEMRAVLRELLWELMDADPEIWAPDILAMVERQRVQARRDHHHCMRGGAP